MTLTKAIESLKEATLQMLDDGGFTDCDGNARTPTHVFIGGSFCHAAGEMAVKSLAALPDKPMTEDEIMTIIYTAWDDKENGGDLHKLMQVLKAANVLYVEE